MALVERRVSRNLQDSVSINEMHLQKVEAGGKEEKNMWSHYQNAEAFPHLSADHFDIIRADTPELLDEVFRLRYQVYCLEKQFESATAHTDGREIDADDDRSAHALLIHRRTGAYAGTVRVILPVAGQPHRQLPTERILAAQAHENRYPWHRTAEISRFLVSKQFRRRRGEEFYADFGEQEGPPAIPEERRMAPYITFGLIRGVLEICAEHRVTHICAVMDPALIRILGRFGLHFEQIGHRLDYRGPLQPCIARLDELIKRNRAHHTPLWEYTRNIVQASPQSIAA